MKIEEFVLKYGGTSQPIQAIVEDWVNQKQLDDFLGATVMSGVTFADLIKDGTLMDIIPLEARRAFKNLMGEKADTIGEIREIFLEKMSADPEQGKALAGLINKIQGQIGEDQFQRVVGNSAKLADLKNQEAYDIVIDRGRANEYVQVKVYEDANAVIEKIKEANEKVVNGEIHGLSGEPISQINLAVNSDIYAAVKEKAGDLGLPNHVYNIRASRDELRDLLEDETVENIKHPIDHFFSELIGGVAIGTGLHAAVNGFLVWKGAKDRACAIEDTFYSSITSTGGLIAAHSAEALLFAKLETTLGFLGGPIGGAFIFGVGLGVRSLLRRFFDRRFLVERLIAGNKRLINLNRRFAPA